MKRFEFEESEAAVAAGVSRDRFKEARLKHLKKGKGYELVRGRILLTAAGLKRVLKVLGVSGNSRENSRTPGGKVEVPVELGAARVEAPTADSGAKNATTPPYLAVVPYAGPNKGLRTLVVCKFWKNTRLVGARPPGGGAIVRVRVKSNKNFVRGMEIPVLPVPGRPGLFELARRCPRSRGRW